MYRISDFFKFHPYYIQTFKNQYVSVLSLKSGSWHAGYFRTGNWAGDNQTSVQL